ncbi:MAG: hypothetical protein DRK00_01160 [Thermoprotei archaeon]|nr:MAG: hypothetical protein DRK00_01160 [Thermoprotei archaeon]
MVAYIRVASISMYSPVPGSDVVNRNVAKCLELVKLALYDEPDLILLTEAFPTRGLSSREGIKYAQELNGPIIERFARIAEEHGVHIVCPLYTREEGRVYNSAVLIDERGEVVGVYHKMYPTVSEIDAGIVPGTRPGIFDTKLGKLGVAICFDINFDEIFTEFRERDVKLVLFPSAFPGGRLLEARALLGKHYIVSALWEGEARIVDPLGRVLARSSSYNPIIVADLNMDFKVLHLDFNYLKFPDLKRKYGKRMRIDVERPEAFALLASECEVSVEEVMREFELEERDEYFNRSRKRAEEARHA